MLDAESKRFEDLEFQQLERESRQDEEKETHMQQLLREIADYQRSTVTRKVTAVCLRVLNESQCYILIENPRLNKLVLLFHQERLLTLKKQAAQITQQAQREKESFLKERSTLEAMLQRVRGYPCLHAYACGRPCFCV